MGINPCAASYEKSPAIKPFKGQQYEYLKTRAQQSGVLFVDPEFPADDTSLFYKEGEGELSGEVVWKRPKEIHENPKLCVDGTCSCDVVQGQLGNCWFVAACSSLAQEKELWNKVIPDSTEQDWDEQHPENYAGIFHFRFWRIDGWVDVVIDDQLPTIDDNLVYISSRDKNEFWGSLLEKAYAKLYGTYEALDGGYLCEALVDFTGGISEAIDLQKDRYIDNVVEKMQLFKTLRVEMDNHSLMCAAISSASEEEMEAQTDVGLVKGHAYGITAVKKIDIGETGLMSIINETEKICMLRLRNPWGEKEWNGPFSDGSEEWTKISEAERKRIGLTFDEDGEFWMTFDDFCRHFTDLSICRILNTSWFSFSKTWCESSFLGKWTVGEKGSILDRAGGCHNFADSFLRNPQYCFDVKRTEDSVMIFLSQRARRALRKDGIENLSIGFYVLMVEVNRQCRLHSLMEFVYDTDYDSGIRGVFQRCILKAGRYVVIPTTFSSGEEGEFLLRIFTSEDMDGKELIVDVPDRNLWPCISYPCLVTQIVIKGATGLQKQDRFANADPYCIVKCEGEKIRSPVCHDTLNPVWNLQILFYRKSADSLIKIKVWNRNVVMDTYLGKAVIDAPLNPETVEKQVDLMSRGCKKPGTLEVEIATSDDLMHF